MYAMCHWVQYITEELCINKIHIMNINLCTQIQSLLLTHINNEMFTL